VTVYPDPMAAGGQRYASPDAFLGPVLTPRQQRPAAVEQPVRSSSSQHEL